MIHFFLVILNLCIVRLWEICELPPQPVWALFFEGFGGILCLKCHSSFDLEHATILFQPLLVSKKYYKLRFENLGRAVTESQAYVIYKGCRRDLCAMYNVIQSCSGTGIET